MCAKSPASLAVDVGCGSGQASLLLSPLFSSVLATDVSREQIRAALERREEKPENVAFK